MTKQRLIKMLLLGIKQFRNPYYQGFAAQVAFYFLLSIVPIIIVLSQLLGVFSISLDTLGDFIEQYVSGDVANVILGLLAYQSTSGMNIVLIVIALWAASKAEFCLMRIANYTLSGGKSTGNGYFKERVRAVKTMVLTLFTLTFALIILVYGELIIGVIGKTLAATIGVTYEVDIFWLILRYPVTMALYFLMVSYNYYVLPSTKLKFRDIVPGSLFASIGMLVVTLGYKVYTGYIANYDILYGSMASVVAVMMWFYFLAWALGLGIMCNKVWVDTRPTVQ